jgi:hypothetical protein
MKRSRAQKIFEGRENLEKYAYYSIRKHQMTTTT